MKKKIIRILTVALFTLCIAGFAACRDGGKKSDAQNQPITPIALSAPKNIHICHNLTATKKTNHILTWNEVENADEYEIKAFTKTFTTNENSYDLTGYFPVGQSVNISVRAISKTERFLDSESASINDKAEEITEKILYTLNGEEYTASHDSIDATKRLVFPDMYDGKPITKLMRESFDPQFTLTSVRLPQYLTVIGTSTFKQSNLASVTIPEGVTTIEAEAFYVINPLKKIVFPTTLVEIKENAFGNCGLESLLLPDNLKTIGTSAFAGCKNLKEVILPDGLQTINPYAFEHCDQLTTLHIPKGVIDLKGGALFNNAFTEYTVAEDNPAYKTIDGNVYRKDGSEFVQYATGKDATEFTIPDGVTKIGPRAFYAEEDLLSVSLSQGLTEIGDYAFCGCGIMEIEFPYGLTTIGEGAFTYEDHRGDWAITLNVSNLTSIILPGSVTSFGNRAFSTKQLNTLVLSKNIKVISTVSLFGVRVPLLELPEGITLEAYSFSSAYIPQLIVPKNFTCEGILSRSAFAPTIIDIFYKGTKTEWESLKETGAFDDNDFSTETISFWDDPEQTFFPIYYYSEEEPPLNEEGTAYDGNYWHYAEDGVTPVIWEK